MLQMCWLSLLVLEVLLELPWHRLRVHLLRETRRNSRKISIYIDVDVRHFRLLASFVLLLLILLLFTLTFLCFRLRLLLLLLLGLVLACLKLKLLSVLLHDFLVDFVPKVTTLSQLLQLWFQSSNELTKLWLHCNL